MTTSRALPRLVFRVFALFLLLTGAAWGQGWPQKPIKLVVPYPAGGPTDTVSRLVGQKLTERLGQPVVVENRPGAGGEVAANYVVKSPADGYTLMMLGTSTLLSKYLGGHPSYDILKDFATVASIYDLPIVMIVNPQVWPNVKTLQDVIAKAREGTASGTPVNYITSAIGGVGHLTTEMLKDLAKFDMQHVPYNGGAPAITALLGGQVPVMFADIIVALPNIQAGKVRAVAVGSAQRLPMLPDVKTINEQGLPGFVGVSWGGLLAPAGTPKDVISRVDQAVKAILEDKEIQARFQKLGVIATYQPADQMAARMKEDFYKWGKVIQDHHVLVQ